MSAAEVLPVDDSRTVTTPNGTLRVDTNAHAAYLNGQHLYLTPSEFYLLETMAEDPDRCVPFSELGEPASVHGSIGRLRAKVGEGWIENVWGIGYRLVPLP